MSSPAICRPISIVSKVLEHHISNIIMDDLEEVAPISALPLLPRACSQLLIAVCKPWIWGTMYRIARKFWRGIKFGGLTVLACETAKLKSAKIYTACM